MTEQNSIRIPRILPAVFALIQLFTLSVAPMAQAQFGLPKRLKVPKLPGTGEEAPAKESASRKEVVQLPPPELLSIRPDSAPPGGSGDLMLTGRNFTRGLQIRMSCNGGTNPVIESFKVEDGERAMAHLKIPFGANEGPCLITMERRMLTETGESAGGTFEVFQVPDSGPKLSISMSGELPTGVSVLFLAEGNQDYMNLMQKLQEAITPGFGNNTEKTMLVLAPDSVKCVRGQTVLFSQAVSDVTAVEEMGVMGQNTGIFRIAFKNGKIYNLMRAPAGGEGEPEKTAEFVKKRLGK